MLDFTELSAEAVVVELTKCYGRRSYCDSKTSSYLLAVSNIQEWQPHFSAHVHEDAANVSEQRSTAKARSVTYTDFKNVSFRM